MYQFNLKGQSTKNIMLWSSFQCQKKNKNGNQKYLLLNYQSNIDQIYIEFINSFYTEKQNNITSQTVCAVIADNFYITK